MKKTVCKKMKIALITAAMLVVSSSNALFAANKQTTFTLKATYHDPILTFWKLGTLKTKVLWTYNDSTKKLVDQKDITFTGSLTGVNVTDKKQSWVWYNTTDRNGSGRAKATWHLSCGLDTQWINLTWGNKDCCVAVNVYGDGSHSKGEFDI